MTNQQIYSEYGIMPSDVNLIADKLQLSPGDRSEEAVAKIRAMYSAAQGSGQTLKKYLATIEVEDRTQAQAPNPRPDRVSRIQVPTDEAAVDDFNLVVRGAVSGIVGGSVNVLSVIDNGLTDHEEAFSDAVAARLKQSKGRAARLVVSKLEHDEPAFFQFAPTGAVESFAEQASRILALDSGVRQYEQPALKQATVMGEENDQETQRQVG